MANFVLKQKPKKCVPKWAGKKKPKAKKNTKTAKKTKVTTKVANGSAKEDVALMDNAAFEDTEMTEIKVEIPGNIDEVLNM